MGPRTLLFLALTSLVAACGSRTGLLVPEPDDASVAQPDAPADVADSSRPEVTPDAVGEPDADVFDAVAEPDADVLDAAAEPDADVIDAVSEPDADAFDAPEEPDTFIPFDAPDECPDGGATLIYVITSNTNALMSFYPPTGSFTPIGIIQCPDDGGTTPFSMAVSRAGIAYVEYGDGNLFRVSTKTAACQPTPFVVGNGGFPTNFGMGFSADTTDAGPLGDGGETLYLAGNPGGLGAQPIVLGALDTSTFLVRTIGQVSPPIYASELTGTGAGQLFGFFLSTPSTSGGASIGQIDKSSAALIAPVSLPTIDINGGWAFAFWGGDFYTFTAPVGPDTVVQRYRPSDGSVVTVARLTGQSVVGAGVSTCAP
jgi:hypothetical protein